MLIQFSIKNFMSIKDKITFSMLASKDKEHEENLNGKKGNGILGCILFEFLNIIITIFIALNLIVIEYMKNIYIIILMVSKQKYLRGQM